MKSTLTGVLFLVCFSQPAFAQQNEMSLREKTKFYAHKILFGDSIKPIKDKYILIVPIISYKPETRWLFGISSNYFFRPTKDTSRATSLSLLRVNASYSVENQFNFWPKIQFFTNQNKWLIQAQYQYTIFSENYWGIGIDVPDSTKERYGFHMNQGLFRVSKRIGKIMYAGANITLENMKNMEYPENSRLLSSDVPGSKGYYAAGIGFNAILDTRDHAYYPYKGVYADVLYTYFNNMLGADYKFHQITLDARYFIQLWKENIFAIQAYANMNSQNVPFRMMGTLGNEMYFRGYYQGRYRDLDAIAFQAEFRKTIFGPFAGVVFAGAGSVSPNLTQQMNHFKPALGAGLRIRAIKNERVNFRIDYAVGVDGSRTMYINMNEAF